jgi:hypothetical protein
MAVRSRLMAVGLLLALAACAPGCRSRPKLVAVTGKVLHKGQPLTAGSIFFHPRTADAPAGKSSCLLQVDGSFTMRTFPYGDGVPPGSYKVTLSPDLAGRIKRPDLADPDRTPLALDVPDEGVHDHVFEVK